MPQFHETGYGKKFYDRQLPTLTKTLQGIEKQLEIQNQMMARMMELMENAATNTQMPTEEDTETEEDDSECWRRNGCVFNSNTPSFYKCQRKNYSVEQCRIDNQNEFDHVSKY